MSLPTPIRLIFALVIILVTAGGAKMLGIALQPPKVEFPSWTVSDMPMQLGIWNAEKQENDPKITAATEAKFTEDRLWTGSRGTTVSMHAAMFEDPGIAVWHSPPNCYRGQGYQKISERTMTLPSDDEHAEVQVSVWEKNGSRITVVYWFQIDKYTIFDRYTLGITRGKLKGLETWPPTMKVLLQIKGTGEDTTDAILDMAKEINGWLLTKATLVKNEPEKGEEKKE